MRKYITIVFYLLLAVVFQFETLIAQPTLTATPDPAVSNQIEFEVDNLPNRTPNLRKYNDLPYHQAFVVFGDGNFIRVGDLTNPLESTPDFSHLYRDMSNSYPAALRLIERKNDDDPPDEDEMVLPDGDTSIPGGDFVNVGGVVSSPVILNEINTSLPASPMLDPTTTDKVAIGLSHYASNRYYLKDNGIHVFPIAFKPQGEAILLFFYNDNNLLNDFRHYKDPADELLFSNHASSSFPYRTGTILPNYFDTSISTGVLSGNMTEILEEASSSLTFSASVQPINPMNFQKGIRYYVTNAESDLIYNDVIQSTAGGPASGELRLFHFLKSENLVEGWDYPFVVALYDRTNFSNEDRDRKTIDDTQLMNLIDLPERISDGPNNFYNYVDAALLKVEHGEPDDPNELTIEKICKCCDEYIIDFKLTFFNKEDAKQDASGANILIDNIDGLVGSPLLSDFKLLECSSPNPPNCSDLPLSDPACRLEGLPSEISDPADAHYCFDFSPGLKAGEYGHIRFSAKIQAADVDRLKTESLLQFCIKFHGTIDAPPVCGQNKPLDDTICEIVDPETGEIIIISQEGADRFNADQFEDRAPKCRVNPIWADKDTVCNSSICNCNTCFICCTWYCWVCLLILLGLLGFFVRWFVNRGKNT